MFKTIMKYINRILGICLLSLFIVVYVTDWEYSNAWFPIVLINLFAISVLFEIFHRIKQPEKRFVNGIFFLVLEGFIVYTSIQVVPVFSYNFLRFTSTVYENETIIIEKYEGFFKKPTKERATYYLLEHGLANMLIREVEVSRKEKNPEVCIVNFPRSQVVYDLCENKLIHQGK